MRDALLIVGGLLIVGVLAHGAWVAWRARRNDLRERYERNIPNLDLDDIDLLRAELPSGGARVVSRPDVEPDAEPSADDDGDPVPVLLDPVDQEPDADAASRPVETGEQTAEPEAVEDAAEPPPRSEPEQAPLFAGEPIVAQDRGGRRPADSRKPVRERKPAQQEEAAGGSEEPEIEDVLVINVLRRDGQLMPGSDLLEVVSEHGLRYGDMNIFHRHGAGQRVDFSMANAVKPGTFDLGAIDELRTPGVTFFMRLPGPDQPMEAFDDLANVARDMARRLDAELKDERHSVMTAQTLEHCRQRIREFRRRQMSRRS